jgi:hypothetical protein
MVALVLSLGVCRFANVYLDLGMIDSVLLLMSAFPIHARMVALVLMTTDDTLVFVPLVLLAMTVQVM